MQVRSGAVGTMFTISKSAGDNLKVKHLPVMRVLRHRSKRNGPLSDDAIVVIAAIGIDGGGRLGWGLGLGEEGEEGEEGIH
jgi:hypothetical protein